MKPTFISNVYKAAGRKRLLILADCPLPLAFITSIGRRANATIDLQYIDTSRETQRGILYRHLSYLYLSLIGLCIYGRYNYLLFWQQFIGVYWGVINRFVGRKKIAAGLLPLIITRRSGITGYLKLKVFGAALNNDNIHFAVCHSQNELLHYKALRSLTAVAGKIKYAPFGSTSLRQEVRDNGNYIFSGGTSNRDYATLIEAVRNLDVNLIIACKPEDVNLKNLPSNVKVVFNAYGGAFDKLIAGSFLNVIPLKDTRISSGQLCLLKAMSYGKPIVATASAGVEDYLDETCAYLVPSASPSHMKMAIFRATMNRNEAIEKGVCGYKRFADKFNIESLGEMLGGLFHSGREIPSWSTNAEKRQP